MYDTIILETDISKCVKILNIVNKIVSEKLLVEKEKQAVVFIDFITIQNLQNNEISKLKKSNYEEFDYGFSNEMNITLNNQVVKSIQVLGHYKIFLKKMNPDFENEQTEGFSEERLQFIKNNYARVFSYIICIEDKNFLIKEELKNIIFNKNIIYTALSEKGFILGDISLIKSNVCEYPNLLKAFTTTDLANDLFQEGLMILTWGMTPYQYFIGFFEDIPKFVINEKYKRNFSGKYKIRKEINSLTLIKGELISNFKEVNDSEKHKLIFTNQVEIDDYYYISLSLYVVDTDSYENPISPVCFFVLDILDYEIDITEPALNYNIFS